jgi:ribosomal protein L11 methylase PrmA
VRRDAPTPPLSTRSGIEAELSVGLATEPAVERDGGSYRDPSGYVFRRDGVVYRAITASYADEWESLRRSGLYDRLAERGWLVPVEVVPVELADDPDCVSVIRPEPIDFVSYPYEWTFGQLQDAALLTIDVHEVALREGFVLKDATAYNVQYQRGRPMLIDSLSFERAVEGAPWVAYRQFCEQFLGPLALMAYRDIRVGLWLRDFLDGIPLDLASSLLPRRTLLRLGMLTHVHLHARAQRRYADRPTGDGAGEGSGPRISTTRHLALLESLRAAIHKLAWKPAGTEWADYDDQTSYDDAATRAKEGLVGRFVRDTGASTVWDLGSNTGRYSRIATDQGCAVVAFDIDPAAAERHYRRIKADGRTDVLPLVMDLANPSPGLGWAHAERRSLADRADADTLLALALIHHLVIGRNVPMAFLADFLAELAPNLVIEFVPKADPMVRHMLATRRDVFADYHLDGFRSAFARRWRIEEEAPIEGTARVLLRLARIR